MNLYLANTDHDWYEQLMLQRPDEVNFWFPSSGTGFAALQPGEPLLFKAKAPRSGVIGGGFFVSYVRMPASLAWNAFGDKNGARSFQDLLSRINRYRGNTNELDPIIGCLLLNEPFFFPEAIWVDLPTDWARNIVRGKVYRTDSELGARLWDSVVARLADPRAVTGPSPLEMEALTYVTNPIGPQYLTTARLGQGTFRLEVLDAYGIRCAVSGERVKPVLEAAHIKPYASNGPNIVSNGLSLRADIHRLFDLGYVTVDTDLRFRVSRRLDSEFSNGVDYYRFDGEPLRVIPASAEKRASREFLQWHGDVVFRP